MNPPPLHTACPTEDSGVHQEEELTDSVEVMAGKRQGQQGTLQNIQQLQEIRVFIQLDGKGPSFIHDSPGNTSVDAPNPL